MLEQWLNVSPAELTRRGLEQFRKRMAAQGIEVAKPLLARLSEEHRQASRTHGPTLKQLQERFAREARDDMAAANNFAIEWHGALQKGRRTASDQLRFEWLRQVLGYDEPRNAERQALLNALPFIDVIEQGALRQVSWFYDVLLSRLEELESVPERERTPAEIAELRWMQAIESYGIELEDEIGCLGIERISAMLRDLGGRMLRLGKDHEKIMDAYQRACEVPSEQRTPKEQAIVDRVKRVVFGPDPVF